MKHREVVWSRCLIVLLHLIPVAKCEVYTAIVDMQPLLYTEGEAAKALAAYIEMEEEKLQTLRTIKDQYQKLYEKAMEDPTLFLANPVNAYLVVKHLNVDWNTVQNLINDKKSQDVITNLAYSYIVFPGPEDMAGAAEALFRLQETYLLNTTDLAKGHIKGAAISMNMTASDCFELGLEAYNSKNYYHAGLWLTEASNHIGDENPKSIKKSVILEYLAHVYFLIKDTRKAIRITEQVIAEEPEHPLAHKNLKYYMSFVTPAEARQLAFDTPELENISLTRLLLLKPPLDPFFGDYNKLCRGEKVRSPKEEKNLHCRYTSNNSRYLLLQPVKEEVISLQPRITIYHDIISDKDTQLFIDMALPTLSTATVVNSQTAALETASYRVSKSAWLYDETQPRIAQNMRILEELLGLDNTSSEPLHVITYGIGGHYDPHFDFRREHEADGFMYGNRIATWIYYLSDVDAGGSTVFSDIGVEVKAEKGSAVTWFNLWRNGTGVMQTKHAACPVLAGTKWIANKWFHEHQNEFKRPCALNRNI